jgi:hypothetical protein
MQTVNPPFYSYFLSANQLQFTEQPEPYKLLFDGLRVYKTTDERRFYTRFPKNGV